MTIPTTAFRSGIESNEHGSGGSSGYSRTTSSEEWGALLKRVSGVIETSSWDGPDPPTAGGHSADSKENIIADPRRQKKDGHVTGSDDVMSVTTTTSLSPSESTTSAQPHAAQRSMQASAKLPAFRSWQVDPSKRQAMLSIDRDGRTLRLQGKLTNENVLDLFRRRRDQPHHWDAARLAQHFHLEEEDVVHLLAFTRTYMGRMDEDGVLRGYYNPSKDQTISRFESE